jgi:hypothetical protein
LVSSSARPWPTIASSRAPFMRLFALSFSHHTDLV